MSNYKRIYIPGGRYFFTVVCWKRKPVFAQPENVGILRRAFKKVRQKMPMATEAIVVLPDHLHCLWKLPDGDSDYPARWREIKKYATRRIAAFPGEKIWQPRYWEHTIRDEEDWRNHVDYIHYNPVKHGLADSPLAWPYSSFQGAVEKGWYASDWGKTPPENIADMVFE